MYLAPAPPKTIPNEVYGCPDINPLIQCVWFNKECDTETNQPCHGWSICCPNECGTSCKVPSYIEPSPIRGCPPINTSLRCFWLNEQCNQSDKRCPIGSVCCGDNCGTWCVDKRQRCKPNPVKGCPLIDTAVQCIWFNEQCNDTDKPCPSDSICCGNNCGTSCIKK